MKYAVVVLLWLWCCVLYAQEPVASDSPLLPLLAALPDIPQTRAGVLSFADYAALAATRPGAAQPASLAELLRLEAAGDPSFDLWLAAFQGLSSGPEFVSELFVGGPQYLPVVGFDFFAVRAGIAFGVPPAQGLVLAGDFDAAQITAAYAARDYVAQVRPRLTLLCSTAACDEGLRVDLARRDTGNPFGGRIGRAEPLALLPDSGLLLNAPNFAVLEALLPAALSGQDTLADQPDYAALAQVATASGTLIQMQFTADVGLAAAPAALALPPYGLLAIAQRLEADAQYADVLLSYTDEAGARAALSAITTRLETAATQDGRPVLALFADREMTLTTAVVPAGERFVAQLALRAPLPPDVPGSDGRLVASAAPFRLLIQMLQRRDLGWLAAGP
jgi:hypothetical protein